MKICVLTGASEPQYSTNGGILCGLRSLGHDIWTVGPAYSYNGPPQNSIGVDVVLPDYPHIEYYTYNQILPLCPWTPDFFLCIEPHGYFLGDHKVPSAFYATDHHRAGSLYMKVIPAGQYNIQFIAQPNFFNLFKGLTERSYIILPGYDERRLEISGKNRSAYNNPIHDVVFIGQTGVGDIFGMTPEKRFAFGPPSYDYSERAELLFRLSKDFNVVVSEKSWEMEHFQRFLWSGRIGFNHSILNDISIRCFEVMGAGRWLVTDNVAPYAEGIFQAGINCDLYDSPYRPFYENFDITYRRVAKMIEMELKKPFKGYEHIRQEALRKHTWTKRAEKMVEFMEQYLGQTT